MQSATGKFSRIGARWMALSAFLVAAAVWFLVLHNYDPMRGLRTWWLNTLAVEGPKAFHRDDLALVGVDLQSLTLEGAWEDDIEASPALQKIRDAPPGGWPWPRDVHAEAVRRILAAGARAVVVDFVFSSSGEGDDALAQVIADHPGRVFLGATVEETEVRNLGKTAKITGPPESILDGPEAFLGGIAVVNFFPDRADGTIRGFLPYVRTTTDGRLRYPTFSGRAMELLRVPPPDPLPWESIPMLFAGGPGTFEPLPAYELFIDSLFERNYVATGVLRNKLVVYGPSAPTFQDFHPTPFGSMLGAELHLQAINAALEGAKLREVPNAFVLCVPWGAALLVLLLCRWVHHALMRLAVIALLGATIWFGAFIAYAEARWIVDITPALVTLAFAGVATFVVEIVVERLERARTRGFLERYVSKDVAKYLLERNEDILATTRKPVTILFSDVRGFTTLSEQSDAAQLVEQLNEYLTAMVAIVHRHKGTLDKFIGDAVMAVWGNLQTNGPEQDACHGVAAALEMHAELSRLNVGWKSRGMPELEIGIGVNSGDRVMVGNMGSNEKMELTVIGDAVNLAARLEGYTKFYHTGLLIGEETAFLLGDTFVLSPVDVIRVKGKEQPVEVHAVLGRTGEVSPDDLAHLDDYRNALRSFKGMEFVEAKVAFESVLTRWPDDPLARLYADRCDEFIQHPPADDWDGVTTFTSK